jgi:hypothetical protein
MPSGIAAMTDGAIANAATNPKSLLEMDMIDDSNDF